MKVLHVIPSVSPFSGGPAQAIFPMCRALEKRGLELTLLTTDHGIAGEFSNGDAVYDNSKTSGYACHRYKGVSTYVFPSQFGESFKYSRPLSSWLNLHVREFDLVHIHAVFNHACIAAARACQKNRIPYIVRPLGTLDPWSMKQKPFRKKLFWELAAKKMLHRASAVHYTAQAELCATERLLGLKQGRVVPLGIDASQPANSESNHGLGEGRPYVLVLSRLHPKKGLDVLIEAFLKVRKRPQLSDWSLVIAGDGDGEYLELLKRIVSEKRANEFVAFRGWLEGEEKKVVLQNASLLALPSHQENFGLCVLEAMAQGVPVLISQQVNLAQDIELAGAGWISAVDVLALEQSLVQALSDQEERNKRGRAGKGLSLNFNWDRIAHQIESMYSSVVASR